MKQSVDKNRKLTSAIFVYPVQLKKFTLSYHSILFYRQWHDINAANVLGTHRRFHQYEYH